MRLSEKVHIKEKLIRRFPILKDEITCIFLMKYHNVLVILFSIDSFLFLKVYDLKVHKEEYSIRPFYSPLIFKENKIEFEIKTLTIFHN